MLNRMGPRFYTLLPEDDGKILHLRFENQALYKNDVLCTIGFPNTRTPRKSPSNSTC